MAALDTSSNVPEDNPLSRETPEEVMLNAKIFWRGHQLHEIVDEDDFTKGALVFLDLKEAVKNEYESPNHTDQERNSYTYHQNVLYNLSPRQKTSIRRFGRKTKYADEYKTDSNIIKKFIFAAVDFALNPFSKQAEENRKKSGWDHIKTLSSTHWTILCTCFLAAMTQGWDQASMNGANIAWPVQLGVDITRSPGVSIFGWLNAAPFFIGAFVGSLGSDPLIHAGFGRRWAIIFGGICSLIPVVCTFFVTTWREFMWCRIMLGVGMGAKASVVPIFISEIAPNDIRGKLSMCWQLFDTMGILLGSIANLIIYSYTESQPNWRFMIGISSIPALMFLTLAIFCVESPRWLLKKNKYQEALNALILLHELPSPIIACGELYLIFRRLKDEETIFSKELDKKKVRLHGDNFSRSSILLRQDYGSERDANTTALEPRDKVPQRLSLNSGHNSITNMEPLQAGPSSRVNQIERSQYDFQVGQSDAPGTRNVASPQYNPHEKDLEVERTKNIESSQATGLVDNNTGAVGDGQPRLEDASWKKRVQYLWKVDRIRRALYSSQCVMAAQQGCGINVLAFMSTVTFAKAIGSHGDLIHLTPDERQRALIFSVYFSIANHFSTWIPVFLIDSRGRRALLIFTFPLMALCLFISGGALFLRESHSETKIKLFNAFTILFTIVFSIGEGPAAFVISSEVFPLIVRELGMSLAVFSNFFLASILSFCIPHGITIAANTGGFWIAFGALNLVFWVLSLLFVYDTQRETLEGMDKIFSISWREYSWLGKKFNNHFLRQRKT